MKKYINKIGLAAIVMMSSWSAAIAQDATAAVPAASNGTDSAVWTLFGVAFVLLIGIAILSFALLRITQYSLTISDKTKTVVVLAGMLLLSQWAMAQDATATAAAPKAGHHYSINMIVAVAVVLMELVVLLFLALKLLKAINVIDPRTVETKAAAPSIMDQLNASVSLEKEKDILLDHDYDGIKELDNNLPPWWLYGFYMTIAWALIYFIYYQVAGIGLSSTEAYEQEMETAKAEVAAYMKTAGNNIDENTVKLDPAMVAEGKKLFAENCKACHGETGGSMPGGIGPNLTDEYWIHGGSIQEVFKTIKYGWPDKGMQAWQNNFTGGQIAELTNYVISIQGTNPPNAKEPQGTKAGAAAATVTDSTAATAVVDTTKK